MMDGTQRTAPDGPAPSTREALDDVRPGQRKAVLAQCTLVAVLDGFDTQLIAFIAPLVTAQWHLTGTQMGQVLTSGLGGLMVGTLILGPISDRVGRRPQLLCCVLLFALCTIASAMSGSVMELLFWRVLTGIGLGGAVASCYALAAEFAAPGRLGINVSIVKAAFPVGAALGALASPFLISVGGWPLVLLMAGLLPLLLFPLLYFKLPESPGFLAQLGDDGAPVWRRWLPRWPSLKDVRPGGPAKNGGLLTALFTRQYASTTILLWAICFLNLLTIYVFVMWLPTLLQNKGLPLADALYASALFTTGGVFGGLALSAILSRYGLARVLGGACLVGIVAVTVLSMSRDAGSAMFWTTVAGAAILGAQFGTVVLLAGYYPTNIRSTGISWALGVGRIGGLLAPLLGGAALDLGFSPIRYCRRWPCPWPSALSFLCCCHGSPRARSRLNKRAPRPLHCRYPSLSFADHIAHLGTLTRHQVRAPFHGDHSFTLYSTPTPLQAEAFNRLGLDPARDTINL